jgi:hypothetical protein
MGHIRSAEVTTWDLPSRGTTRGVHLNVDGSKIWTVVSQNPNWPTDVTPVPIRPGYRIEVWGKRNHTKLLRQAQGQDATRPVTFKLEPECNDYFVCVLGSRFGGEFDVPVQGSPYIASEGLQGAYCSILFDATNAGDTNQYLIRAHFTTNVEPLDHRPVPDD